MIFSYIENVRICPTVPQQEYIVEIAWLFLWDSRPTEFHTSHKNFQKIASPERGGGPAKLVEGFFCGIFCLM